MPSWRAPDRRRDRGRLRPHRNLLRLRKSRHPTRPDVSVQRPDRRRAATRCGAVHAGSCTTRFSTTRASAPFCIRTATPATRLACAARIGRAGYLRQPNRYSMQNHDHRLSSMATYSQRHWPNVALGSPMFARRAWCSRSNWPMRTCRRPLELRRTAPDCVPTGMPSRKGVVLRPLGRRVVLDAALLHRRLTRLQRLANVTRDAIIVATNGL
jgi:hypothetical protein